MAGRMTPTRARTEFVVGLMRDALTDAFDHSTEGVDAVIGERRTLAQIMLRLLSELGEASGPAPCSFCNGKGEVMERRPREVGPDIGVTCPSCKGDRKAEGFVTLIVSDELASWIKTLQEAI